MKKNTRYYAICLSLVILCVTFLELPTYYQSARAIENGWLDGWQYRKRHDIAGVNGAGTNYQVKVSVAFSAPWFEILPTNIPIFMTTDVSSDGTVFAGDDNYHIYKSTDSGVTFSNIYTIPAQSNPWGEQAGKIWTVFVDSRDYLLISAGSTNRLYRSTDGGISFSEVLNLPDRSANDGMVISITEDASGNLYAAEYANVPPARLWKSIDSGATWSSLRSWNARHLHAVKFNPYNGWLYVVTGEAVSGTTEHQTVWRSKDGGSNWQLIVARGSGADTKYLSIEFIGNDIYLGQDRNGPSDTDDIHKVTDDGVNEPFSPVTVYDNPYPAAVMTAATKVGDTIIFATSSEGYTATCQVVKSNDGNTWTVLNTQPVSPTYRWINQLTIHPRKGIVYGCINNNYAYFVASPSTPRPPSLQAPSETVSLENHCKTDFGDIRFTDDDGTTLLDYWMETKSDGINAVFWVEVADDLSSVDRTIYVYYGKSDTTTTSNADNTFLFFDDFNGGLSKWITVSGTWSISNGTLSTEPPTGEAYWNNYLVTANPVGTNSIAIRAKMKTEQAGDGSAHPGLAWHANTLTGTSNRNDHVYFRPHQYGSSSWANVQPAFYDGNLEWHGGKFGGYFSWSTWYEIEARIPPSGNVKLYGSDAYWYDWDNQQYSYDHIGVAAHDMGKDYWDYILVRKYTDPEPVHGNWGSEETAQLTPPNFGSIGANTTIAGSPFQMSCPVNSTTNVSHYIYSWNNTGSWVNHTVTPFTDFINSSAAYAKFSDTWNTIAGHTVSVKIYANDTYNNWNASSQYNFAITSASASRLVFTAGAGQSLTAGQLSGQVTVQRQDQYGNPVTSESLTVDLSSTSLGAAFYSDTGTTQASSVTINDGSSSVSFWYKDTAVGSPTLNVSAAGLSPATTTFMITSANLNHFTITAIPNPQTAGTTFNITITATDQYGNTVTSYTGSNTLNDLSGTISPTSTSSFSEGVWTGSVTITKAYYSDTISTFSSGKSGTTNSFDVHPGAFDHFTVSSYPSSIVTGQSFDIAVTAWDAFGNVVTGYAGQVYFTSSDGQAVLPYTIGSKYTFTSGDNGSHTFTGFELDTVPLQTITVTDSVKSATSNLIAVILPITPPSYSSISVSSTFAGQSCTFHSAWNDNYGLSGYILSTNNTGLWQNTTWTPFSGTPSWASVTQNLNSNIGAVIGYNWYANNTNGLWNNTGIQTLTTADSAPGLSFSVISNSTVSELAFNSTSQLLEFTVSGPSGTIGFTNVTITKTLISDVSTLKVYLNGSEINYTINDLTSYWLIHFTYHHSTHKVVLDFFSLQTKTSVTPLNGVPVAIIGLVIVIFTTLAISIKRKAKFPNSTKQKSSSN